MFVPEESVVRSKFSKRKCNRIVPVANIRTLEIVGTTSGVFFSVIHGSSHKEAGLF